MSVCCVSVFLISSGTVAYASGDWPAAGADSTDQGRQLWIANCLTCHGYGIAGAPIPTRAKHWEERLAQTRETLYQHAIEGFFGRDGTYMPPRGDNAALTDEEVKLAVDYMLELAQQHLNSLPSNQDH